MQIYSDKIFKNPIKIIEGFDNDDLKFAFEEIEKYSKTHYLLGYIRYEAKDVFLNKKISSKLPLIYFEVYESFEPYFPNKIEGVSIQLNSKISYENYKIALAKIKEEIAQGNTYEVNYTHDYDVSVNCKAKALYEFLLAKQKTPYNAFLQNKYETILSFSPELFFELIGNKIKTKPMKGTIARGTNQIEDDANIEFLKNDIKNRAENVMIVDLLRNDLSKIAQVGSVKVDKLFEIETHKSLHQMTSEISAVIKPKTSLYDIFQAIFPCGSITGAPKISTMNIIEQVEIGNREVYCGAIGFISPQKYVFSVPIRILQKRKLDKSYTYRVGGAIVWDSTPKDEWAETITKTKFLENDFKLVETILVENNKLILKNEHFKRIKNSAKELGFEFDIEKFKNAPTQNGMLRITIAKTGEVAFETLELKNSPTFKIEISKLTTNSNEKFLYHKTTNRPWYEKSMDKIKAGLIYDEIFFNEKAELTEGARSNILLKIEGKLYTPPTSCGILNGVARQKMIDETKCFEKILYKSDLLSADKIYCLNSVRGLVEVHL